MAKHILENREREREMECERVRIRVREREYFGRYYLMRKYNLLDILLLEDHICNKNSEELLGIITVVNFYG